MKSAKAKGVKREGGWEKKKKDRGHERRCGAEARAGNLKDIQEFSLNSAPYFLSFKKITNPLAVLFSCKEDVT